MSQQNRSRRSKTAQLDLFGLAEPVLDAAEVEAAAPDVPPGLPADVPATIESAPEPAPAPEPPPVAVDQPAAVAQPAISHASRAADALSSAPNLAALYGDLQTIPYDEVRSDHAIGAFVALEYEFIATRAKAPENVAALAAIGFDLGRIDRVAVAARACAEALRLRREASDPPGPHAGAEIVKEAVALQRRLVAAIRFHLPHVQFEGRYDGNFAVATGAGDLRMDLHVLFSALEREQASFAADRTIDIEVLREQVERLREGLLFSGARDHAWLHAGDDRDLEDRAFTYLDRCVRELREALTYVWQHDPARVSDVFAPAMARRRSPRAPKRAQ